MFKRKSNNGMLVLVGLPGSAKSKLAAGFTKTFENWVIVNQTSLGSLLACVKAAQCAIYEGKSVIVDRCNISSTQRRTWINFAKDHLIPIDCLELRVPHKILKNRLRQREDYPKRPGRPTKLKVLSYFKKEYELPNVQEGFNNIVILLPNFQTDQIFGPKTWEWLYNAFSIRLSYFETERVKHRPASKSIWNESVFTKKDLKTLESTPLVGLAKADLKEQSEISEERLVALLNNLNMKEKSNNQFKSDDKKDTSSTLFHGPTQIKNELDRYFDTIYKLRQLIYYD